MMTAANEGAIILNTLNPPFRGMELETWLIGANCEVFRVYSMSQAQTIIARISESVNAG
jgi:hypothetical protein